MNFASEVELPGFRVIIKGQQDVEIRRCQEDGVVDYLSDRVTAIKLPGGVEFTAPFGARYVVNNGNEINIFSNDGVVPALERLPFYGFVIAALMKQRGRFVLHGSAVEISGKAVVVVGDKSQGKSTLVAKLLSRGHRLLADDVTALSFDTCGAQVLPGIPLIKLWPEALLASGMNPLDHLRVFAGTEKRNFFVPRDKFCDLATQLSTIIVLGHSETIELHKLSGSGKMIWLAGNNYLARYTSLQPRQEIQDDFVSCTLISKNSEMFMLNRPRRIELLDDAAILIEELLRKGN